MAFADIEPFGPRADDYRSAIHTSLLYNIHRGKSPAKDFKKFLLGDYAQPKPKQSWQEQMARMKMISSMLAQEEKKNG